MNEKIEEAKGEAKVSLAKIAARIAEIKVEKRDENGELIEELVEKYGDDR